MTLDADDWAEGAAPGSPALDAPHGAGWLLDALSDDFVLLARGWRGEVPAGVPRAEVEDLAAERLGLTEGAAALVRPDPYGVARWKSAAPAALLRIKRSKTWLS